MAYIIIIAILGAAVISTWTAYNWGYCKGVEHAVKMTQM